MKKKNFYFTIFFLLFLLNKGSFALANTNDDELVEEFENALIEDHKDSQYFNIAANATNTTNHQNNLGYSKKPSGSDSDSNINSDRGDTTTIRTGNLDDLDTIDPVESDYYLKIAGGVINFPHVKNISKFNGAGGFGLGTSLTPGLKIEANFIYSFKQNEVDEWFIHYKDDVDQYSFSATGAYHWESLNWPLTPIAGVTTSLTHRRFNYDENTSNAFDVGFVLGVDRKINSKLSFGLEYRYMINVDHEREYEYKDRVNSFSRNFIPVSDPNVKALETFDYQFVLLNVKMNF